MLWHIFPGSHLVSVAQVRAYLEIWSARRSGGDEKWGSAEETMWCYNKIATLRDCQEQKGWITKGGKQIPVERGSVDIG